jgi:hypothetical protein
MCLVANSGGGMMSPLQTPSIMSFMVRPLS